MSPTALHIRSKDQSVSTVLNTARKLLRDDIFRIQEFDQRPVEQIEALSAEHLAALIVVARPVARLRESGLARGLVRHGETPVMLVPPVDDVRRTGAIVCTITSPRDVITATVASELARVLDRELLLAHVAADLTRRASATGRRLLERTAALVDRREIEQIVVGGRFADAMARLVDDRGAAALAIGSGDHRRPGLTPGWLRVARAHGAPTITVPTARVAPAPRTAQRVATSGGRRARR